MATHHDTTNASNGDKNSDLHFENDVKANLALEKEVDHDREEIFKDTYGTTAANDDNIKIGFKSYIIVASVSLLSLVITFGIASPAGVNAYTVRNLGSAQDAAWVINAANVMQAVVGVPLSLCSDLYGRRWPLIAMTALGVAGTAISGTANALIQVIGGQILTGCALACKPLCYAIAGEVLPRRWRSVVQYWISILAGIGGTIGAISGPAFVSKNAVDGWRYLYYLESGLFAASLLGVLFFYHPPPRPTTERLLSRSEKLKNVDFIGWLLFASGVTLFLTGITFGGNKFPWVSAQTLCPLIIGFFTMVAFGIWEWKATSTGLMPHDLFKERNFPLALTAMGIEGILIFAALSIYPGEVIKLYTTDPLDQGLRGMPLWLGTLIACPALAYITAKTKNVKWPLMSGYALFLLSSILFALCTVNTSTMSVVAYAIAGLAYAAPLTLLLVVAQLCTPPKYIATASALLSTARAVFAAVGTAIYSAVLTNKLSTSLGPAIAGSLVANGYPASGLTTAVPALVASINAGFSLPLALRIPGMNAAIANSAFDAARIAYQNSYKYVWYVTFPFSILGMIVIFFTKSVAKHMNYQVDAPAEDVHRHKHFDEQRGTQA